MNEKADLKKNIEEVEKCLGEMVTILLSKDEEIKHLKAALGDPLEELRQERMQSNAANRAMLNAVHVAKEKDEEIKLLKARIDAALALHKPITRADGDKMCGHCCEPPWPCPTVKALRGEE